MTTRRTQLQEDTNYRVLRMLQDNPDLPAKLNHRDLTTINVLHEIAQSNTPTRLSV